MVPLDTAPKHVEVIRAKVPVVTGSKTEGGPFGDGLLDDGWPSGISQ
jgi:hypothetical protein